MTILPNFTEGQFSFMEGKYGPFRPAVPVQVPLWLAIELRKFRKCNIKAPDWMDVGARLCFNRCVLEPAACRSESLEVQKQREQQDPKGFQPIHYHYLEVSNLLLHQ